MSKMKNPVTMGFIADKALRKKTELEDILNTDEWHRNSTRLLATNDASQKKWRNSLKVQKKSQQLRNLQPVNVFFENKGKKHIFWYMLKLIYFSKTVTQEMLQEILQAEGEHYQI